MERKFKQVKCIEPFILFGIHNKGHCYSCCPVWSKVGSVGTLNDRNSIMALWNSKKMQGIRKAIFDDQLAKVCDFKYCPYAVQNENRDLEALKTEDSHFNRILDEISAGHTVMESAPFILFLANSNQCNLRCVMCNLKPHYPKDDERLDEILFSKTIPEVLPDISRLSMAGSGEVLLNSYSRKFLQTLSADRYPNLKISLLTNGTLLTPEFWQTIRHNRYDQISVSIDAATPTTYERLRRNGKWSVLRRNLDWISTLRKEKRITEFKITFVVLKSNYSELKQFVELGLELGCDRIFFQKAFGKAGGDENINLTKNTLIFAEIGTLLADPVFTLPQVDTTLIDEYRKYANQPCSVREQVISRGEGVR